MNHVERFRATMAFEEVDRLPRWEWAMWWDLTLDRWRNEGLPSCLKTVFEIHDYFGLDPYIQFWFSTTDPTIEATQHHVEGIVSDLDDYMRLRPKLFPDHSEAIQGMAPWLERQRTGCVVVWITLEGFFWFPRTLMGFTNLMLAFHDQPELIHRINKDLLEFNLDLLAKIARIGEPTFLTLAEDMSYNHGPMISGRCRDAFLAPYYRPLVERAKEMGMLAIVDTDGDVTNLAPWLRSVGIDGVLPLERQAGVDALRLRGEFPDLCMIGHYDKMVMTHGEQAMRSEFERLVPVIKTGGFIPSVDHQTPPGVSLSEYRTYLGLLTEYTGGRAC
ncbi:MAG: hypothetical protein GHCLOJNM_03006 [bacterium]|nr:hypothetical protein [bacterium]